MADYRVTWEIDVFDARSPEEAARQAWDALRRPGSTANVFDVYPADTTRFDDAPRVQVDLSAIDTEPDIPILAVLDEPVLTRPQPVDSPLRREVPIEYDRMDGVPPWGRALEAVAVLLLLAVCVLAWFATSHPLLPDTN